MEQHGGRTPTARGQHAARRAGAPEAVGVSRGTQHNEARTVRLAVADKRVSGKWVGRSLELVEKPIATAAAGC